MPDADDGMEWASISRALPNSRWVCSISVDERRMIGPPAGLQPLLDLVGRHAAAIDRLAAGRHPRDHAEAGGDAGGAVIERPRQGPFEHAGIELVGLAVGVDVGARESARPARACRARGRRRTARRRRHPRRGAAPPATRQPGPGRPQDRPIRCGERQRRPARSGGTAGGNPRRRDRARRVKTPYKPHSARGGARHASHPCQSLIVADRPYLPIKVPRCRRPHFPAMGA